MRTRGLLATLVLGLGLILGLLWLVSASLPVAYAENITVDKFTDENDGSCYDGDCSLRDAIIRANKSIQPDTIILDTGTYTLSLGGPGEDAAAEGDLDITKPLTITGNGPALTIINAADIDRVFDIRPGAGSVFFTGVKVMNGYVDGNGGGIYDEGADLTLINSAVNSNVTTDTTSYGGGIYVASGKLTLQGGEVRHNLADGTDALGGGVYIGSGSVAVDGTHIANNDVQGTSAYGSGLYVESGSATLNGAHLTGNTSDGTGAHGGGLYVGSGSATVNGTYITGNSMDGTSAYGAGLYVGSGSATLGGTYIVNNRTSGTVLAGGGVYVASGQVTLNVTHIISNSAEDGGGLYVYEGHATLNEARIDENTGEKYGGGLYVVSGTVMLNGGQVYSNSASYDGGGVYVELGRAVLSQTVIMSNTADVGGGLYNSAGLTLTNVTLSHNRATLGAGGGLYNAGGGRALLGFATVVDNRAVAGGRGIHSAPGATTIVENTIVANNGPTNCSLGITSAGFNLDSGITCGFLKPSDQPDTLPKLGPLQDNGGNTLTYALMPGSPAIDAGQCISAVAEDQRGRARPNPGSPFCDIGAYEADATGTTDLVLSKTVTPSTAAAGELVTYTLIFTHTGPSGALGVVITDPLPISVTNTSFFTAGATVVPVPGTRYVWRVEDLRPRGGGVITITGELASPLAIGTFTNTAIIATTTHDPNRDNNRASAALAVVEAAGHNVYLPLVVRNQ